MAKIENKISILDISQPCVMYKQSIVMWVSAAMITIVIKRISILTGIHIQSSESQFLHLLLFSNASFIIIFLNILVHRFLCVHFIIFARIETINSSISASLDALNPGINREPQHRGTLK